MVKDGQVRMLMRPMNREMTLEAAAAKAGMTEKTARKYRGLGKLPSQSTVIHDWKTREDAFEGDWPTLLARQIQLPLYRSRGENSQWTEPQHQDSPLEGRLQPL